MVETLSLAVAVGAGVVSFFSPCIVPLIPAYLSHLAGHTVTELDSNGSRGVQRRVFVHALLFVVGFSSIFVLLGSALGLLGQQVPGLQTILHRIGGAIIIVFGLYVLGLLPRVSFLETEHKVVSPVASNVGYLSSAMIGVSFGVG